MRLHDILSWAAVALCSSPVTLAAVVRSVADVLADVHTISAASPSQAPELLLNPSLFESNLNFTTSPYSRLTAPPPDPLVIELAGTQLSLSFSTYTRKIPATDVLTLLLQVSLTITQKVLAARGDPPINIDTEFHFGHAFLIIYARAEPLLYGQLSAMVKAMAKFAHQYGFMGYEVEVFRDAGPRSRGLGKALLRYV